MSESVLDIGEKPFIAIRPPVGWQALGLRDLWQFRDLLVTLAMRDVMLRYRQTALGAFWVVMQPLLAAGIFSFVFGTVAKLSTDGIPHFVFTYAGMLGWTAFSTTLSKSSSCLVQNSNLVSKVFFPRLVLPLSTVLSTLLDFIIGLVVMVLLMVGYHTGFHPALLLLPVWLLLLLLLALGAGLFASALMVTYRDIAYIVPVVMQMLLYASPIAYGVSAVPAHVRPFYVLNPLSGLMEAFRWSLLGQGHPAWMNVGYATVFAIVVFAFGLVTFKKMEIQFADVI